MVREAPRASCAVVPHNIIHIEEVANFDKIIFSPGPGLPKEFPTMFHILTEYATSKSILGVCLGHQAVAEHFGGSIRNLPHPLHGQRSRLCIEKHEGILGGLDPEIFVGQYHSWVVDNVPQNFEITSRTEQGLIMSMMHREFDIQGVQFHPESYMTSHGQHMIETWLAA